MVLHGIALHLMILHSLACHCIVLYGVAWCCIVGFGARAVSRKTPTYFIDTNTFETKTKKEIRTFAFERLRVNEYPKNKDKDFDDERNKNFCV